MILEMAACTLKENTWYQGIISRHQIFNHNSKLIIYVVFNKNPDVEYLKSIRIENNSNSIFGIYAEKLNLYNEDNKIDTDLLDGLEVKATLKKASNGILYVNKLKLNGQ